MFSKFLDADDEVVVAKLSTSVLEDRKGSLFDQNIGPPLDQTQLRNYKTIEQILVRIKDPWYTDIHLRKMNMTPLAILGVKWPFSKGRGR